MPLVIKRRDGESMVYRVPAGEACEIRVTVERLVDQQTGRPTANVSVKSEAPERVEIVRGEVAERGRGTRDAPVERKPAPTPAPPPPWA